MRSVCSRPTLFVLPAILHSIRGLRENVVHDSFAHDNYSLSAHQNRRQLTQTRLLNMPTDPTRSQYDANLPMKCITIKHQHADIEDVIGLSDSWPRPALSVGDSSMILRTLAVSLAPGDVRVLRGHLFFQTPDSFPYIPGGDLCGEVVEVHDGEEKFKVGDVVFSLFDGAPRNALAEFVRVKSSLCAFKPSSVSPAQAAALPSSAMCAVTAVERYVSKGDRVLVLGGSGGVGSHLVQAAKSIGGASFVAATSTQHEMLSALGVDHVIDYRTTRWWEDEGLKAGGGVDVIFDLWGYPEAWKQAKARGSLLKDRGYFVTTAGDNPYPEAQGKLGMLRFFGKFVLRWLWTKYLPWGPRYIYHVGLGTGPHMTEAVRVAVEEGKMAPVLDRASPFEFSTEGVSQAFRLQESRHAHGKVVVKVAEL